MSVSRQIHTHALADFLVHTFVSAYRCSVELVGFRRENGSGEQLLVEIDDVEHSATERRDLVGEGLEDLSSGRQVLELRCVWHGCLRSLVSLRSRIVAWYEKRHRRPTRHGCRSHAGSAGHVVT